MAQFATVDAAGVLTGFFDDSVNQIPSGAVRLTPGQYAQWLEAQSGMIWANGGLAAAPAAAVPTVPLADQATAAFRASSTHCFQAYAMLGQPIPQPWIDYNVALSQIIAGNSSATSLPPEPA